MHTVENRVIKPIFDRFGILIFWPAAAWGRGDRPLVSLVDPPEPNREAPSQHHGVRQHGCSAMVLVVCMHSAQHRCNSQCDKYITILQKCMLSSAKQLFRRTSFPRTTMHRVIVRNRSLTGNACRMASRL